MGISKHKAMTDLSLVKNGFKLQRKTRNLCASYARLRNTVREHDTEEDAIANHCGEGEAEEWVTRYMRGRLMHDAEKPDSKRRRRSNCKLGSLLSRKDKGKAG